MKKIERLLVLTASFFCNLFVQCFDLQTQDSLFVVPFLGLPEISRYPVPHINLFIGS